MDIYEFFRWNLAWVSTIGILYPINMAMGVLAFRVQKGNKIDMPQRELWYRSSIASFLIACVTAGVLIVDYLVTNDTGIPPGPIHLVFFAIFVGLCWWILFYFFGFEEPFEGLSMVLLYLYLPIFVLWPINKLTGLWNPLLNLTAAWLPTSVS